ncbi:hypothetical protein FA09DRAFT_74319 [Tilletiopsis washingtonensis]|jgi:hypothetical protein|uniref:Uncharacterized protein n=1 Tax=Tilletiopsis washingtonensis TaxID=58919 RepID=A0A316Z7K5_9BASI|nr:hypothetical protein FA09DRAFT_74319 [Tilletiopsis washingtonensis]PWN96958.1 hypothetical protein FA09DRAFT_74319 [Tilletiopsis washingtonensis]
MPRSAALQLSSRLRAPVKRATPTARLACRSDNLACRRGRPDGRFAHARQVRTTSSLGQPRASKATLDGRAALRVSDSGPASGEQSDCDAETLPSGQMIRGPAPEPRSGAPREGAAASRASARPNLADAPSSFGRVSDPCRLCRTLSSHTQCKASIRGHKDGRSGRGSRLALGRARASVGPARPAASRARAARMSGTYR